MNNRKLQIKKFLLFLLITNCTLLIVNCSSRFSSDPLTLSTKQNLALLQSDPQFVMYFNFKKMRETEFWSKFINDSLISTERSFGNFLNAIKEATGASISNGIDELYFANSWIGDNSMIVKGTFDRKQVDNFIKSDTNYKTLPYPNNISIYHKPDINFYFYFKDDFTVCASNYKKQIESTINVADTSKTGLLSNEDAMKSIVRIKYKENLWMMSNQKLFIRGIFENFADMNKKKKQSEADSLNMNDTTNEKQSELLKVYENIQSIAFSLKMSDKLEFYMQNECEDEKSAVELKNRIEAIIAVAKLTSQFTNKKPTAVIKMLDNVDVNNFDKTAVLNLKLDQEQVTEIRKQKIF